MKILGIETSCDETAAAVLEIKNGRFKILSNIVASSVKLQAKYGGIVPELAARKQMEMILPIVERSLVETRHGASLQRILKEIDYIAVVNGPGLITSLRVGVETAKTLSYVWQKPLIEVNHLEGHIYSALLNNFQFSIFNFQTLRQIDFPALALIVSGGHTQLVLLKDYLKYKVIGETQDDAVGEAFDKVAKILNLGYPGGPVISKLAEQGNSKKINFPRPMLNSGDYNFSFSGLKTSVLYLTKELKNNLTMKQFNNETIKDICTSFQQACVDVLVTKTIRAIKEYKIKTFLLGGGVAANNELRKQLREQIHRNFDTVKIFIPDIKYTGDNAVMIALAGYYKAKKKQYSYWGKIKTNANLSL